MRVRLQRELNAFLQDYSIAGFRIFRDWVLKAAGLADDCQKYCHFYSDEDDEENLWFRAKGLSEEDNRKLLAFFKQDELDGNKIFLKEDVVFEQLLPDFISYMKKEGALSQVELTKYQLMSKDVLEKKLIKSILDNLTKFQLNFDKEKILFVNHLTTLKQLFEKYLHWREDYSSIAIQISSIFSALKEQVSLYQNEESPLFKQLIELNKFYEQHLCMAYYLPLVKQINFPLTELKEWMNLPHTMTYLNQLNENVSAFERLNRANERSLNKKFIDDVEEFLSTYSISSKKCEIFEHMLLEIADITYKPGKDSRFQLYTNELRTWFTFSHEDDMGEEAEKLIQFFHDCGDVSALIKAKEQIRDKSRLWEFSEKLNYRDYLGGIKIKSHFDKPALITEENPPVVYEFSVDTEILRTVVWPKIKQNIERLARDNPRALEPYQQECRSFFKKKEIPQVSPYAESFFNVAGASELQDSVSLLPGSDF